MFKNFDKKEKVNVEFQNSKFVIKVKDVKKIFDFFILDLLLLLRRLIYLNERKSII